MLPGPLYCFAVAGGVIDDFLDFVEEDLGDFSVGVANLDRGLAEGLSTPQIVDLAARMPAINRDNFDVGTVEH